MVNESGTLSRSPPVPLCVELDLTASPLFPSIFGVFGRFDPNLGGWEGGGADRDGATRDYNIDKVIS